MGWGGADSCGHALWGGVEQTAVAVWCGVEQTAVAVFCGVEQTAAAVVDALCADLQVPAAQRADVVGGQQSVRRSDLATAAAAWT